MQARRPAPPELDQYGRVILLQLNLFKDCRKESIAGVSARKRPQERATQYARNVMPRQFLFVPVLLQNMASIQKAK